MKPSHTSIVQAWFVCFALVSGAHAQEYVVKALGTPTVQTAAMAINKNGIVVGWDLDLAGHFTAVRWDDVTPTQFGAVSGFSHAHGSAVNSSNNAVAIVFSLGTLGSQAMLVDAA